MQPLYTVGDSPTSIELVDVDGANGLDLVSANSLDDNTTVHLNDGSGSFSAGVAYTAGDSPAYVSSEDLDGVNGNDLVVANSQSDSISIFLNNGDGTFASKVDISTCIEPESLLLLDIDSANGPDIFVACSDDNGLSLHKNLGGGSFAASIDYNISITDLDGSDVDGVNGIDVVLANRGHLVVWQNDGTGFFENEEIKYPLGDKPFRIESGDLDGSNGTVTV